MSGGNGMRCGEPLPGTVVGGDWDLSLRTALYFRGPAVWNPAVLLLLLEEEPGWPECLV